MAKIKSVHFEIENTKALAKEINKFGKDGRKVMRYTVSDMKKQAPGIIQQNILKTYNLEKKDFKDKSVVIQRVNVDKKGDSMDVNVVYSGRLLTPRHFDIAPKKPPAFKKLPKKDRYQVQRTNGSYMTISKKRPPYDISYEIFNGKRKTLKSGKNKRFFLNTPRNHNKMLPWQVEGQDKPEVIHTLSVPQMLSNKTVSTGFMKEVNKRLTDRFNHHYKRIIEK